MTFRFFFTGIAIFTYLNLQAQEAGHYFFVNAGGGFHNLSYSLNNGKQKGGAGFTFNGGYNYFFSPNWGLETGLGINSLQSTATLNYMTGTPATDTDGDAYEFRTYYKNWEEKQTAFLLDIPLGINYRKNINEKWGWMASAGVKMSLPLSIKYKVTGGEIATAGYYSQWNVELSDMPQHGFSTITEHYNGKASLNPAFSLYAGLGGLYKLSPVLDLYAGGYINYGVNNMKKASDNDVYQKDGTYNGVLNSNQTDKARQICAGVKIGILWHFIPKKKEIPTQVTPEPIPEVIRPTQPVPVAPAPVVAAEVKKDTIEKIVVQVTQPVMPVSKNLSNDSIYALARTIAVSTEIKFPLNSEHPLRTDEEKIKKLSELLKSNPGMQLVIIGHTCNIATHEVNLEVGMKRAQFIKEEFLRQGVPDAQLHCETKAFDEPLVPNTSEENRAVNRRVQLKVK